MLGDIGIAEIRVFLILVWVFAADVIATVVLYRLHLRKAFAVAATSSLRIGGYARRARQCLPVIPIGLAPS